MTSNTARIDPPDFFINRTRVGLDIDGVICNFHEKIIEIAKERGLGEHFPERWQFINSWHFSPKFAKLFNEVKVDPEFWLSLDSYPGCAETVDFEVEAYITARPIGGTVTAQWLLEHGFIGQKVISTPGPKVPALIDQKIELYVDDKPENFLEINAAGIKCFLMDRPWNRLVETGYLAKNDGLRISSLSEVGEYLRKLEAAPEPPPLIDEVKPSFDPERCQYDPTVPLPVPSQFSGGGDLPDPDRRIGWGDRTTARPPNPNGLGFVPAPVQ